MKALRLVAPQQLIIEDYSFDSELPLEHALVDVKLLSLCGSDYKLYNGLYSGPSKYPLFFGHEWSGKIVDINTQGREFAKGDKVTGDCSKWCGYCKLCEKDKNLCLNIEKFGISIDGYSRQLAVIPLKYLYKVPVDLSYEVAALTECFAVALHAIKKIPLPILNSIDKSILILGGGPIGLAICILLKHHFGHSKITLVETDEARRKILEQILGDSICDAIRINTKDTLKYKDIVLQCQYDIAFEAAGRPETLQTAVNVTHPDGYIVCLGMFPAERIDFLPVVIKGLHLIGSIGGTGEFEEVIKFLSKNHELAKKMVTKIYDMENAQQAFVDYKDRESIKLQIKLSDYE